jgi:hypothetical protein
MSDQSPSSWVRPKPPTLDEFSTAFITRVGERLGINFDPSDDEAIRLQNSTTDDADDPNLLIEDLREDLGHYAVERSMRLTDGVLRVDSSKIDGIIEDMMNILGSLYQAGVLKKLPEKEFFKGEINHMFFCELLDDCIQDTCEKLLGNRNALSTPQRRR